MFIVTPKTVLNPGALAMKQVPRRFFGRANIFPRNGAGFGMTIRMLAEVQAIRYTLPLVPFLVIGFTWQNTALALAQAPVLMILLIGLVEMRLLRLQPAARAALISQTDADRGLDLLRVRGRSILTRIAAGRGLSDGIIHLVVETSDLARIAPLTYVSVQMQPATDRPQIMTLTTAEMAMIRADLFGPPFDERTLYKINMMQSDNMRVVAFDMTQVSAHARLAALMG